MAERVYKVELAGCAPEPLMAYLKALGVLRLVAEQRDAEARGWWQGDIFLLQSVVDSDGLVRFFLEDYRPSPILSPWNGDGGFLSDAGTSVDTIEWFRRSSDSRLEGIRAAIKATDNVPLIKEFREKRDRAKELDKLKKAKERELKETASAAGRAERVHEDPDKTRNEIKELSARLKKIKQSVVSNIRNDFLENSLGWLDCCMTVGINGLSQSPLLGTGGVDGRLDFATNFLLNVQLIFCDLAASSEQLHNSLFARPAHLEESSIGQFSPGQVGGPNATQGREGHSLINRWDFVLMLEGALVLAGAAVRRLEAGDVSGASFPFTVRAVAAGYPSAGDPDEAESRGEIWLPLWGRPATCNELRAIFAEGRAEVSGRRVRNGLDFARAVATVGVDRGIKLFSRYAFLKRSGKAYLASPLGRFEVRERIDVDLLREIDLWLGHLRRVAHGKNPAPRLQSALRQIDRAIFNLCRYGGGIHLQAVLTSLGRAERELALTDGRVRQDKGIVQPLCGLSRAWIRQSDDGSHEFAIARALASLHDATGRIGPLRVNLEPVVLSHIGPARPRAKWIVDAGDTAKQHRAVVWNTSVLPANLCAVLERRCMDGQREGCKHLPLASRACVGLDAIAAFLNGPVDDERIEELLWGLVLIENTEESEVAIRHRMECGPLPRAYALLKLLFLPRPVATDRRENDALRLRLAGPHEEGVSIKPEPAVIHLLRAGRLGEACTIAMRRLRASGLNPLPRPIAGRRIRDDDWLELQRIDPAAIEPQRLAASLLIPIPGDAITALGTMITNPEASGALAAPGAFDESHSSILATGG